MTPERTARASGVVHEHDGRMEREIIECSPNGIVLLDIEGTILEVNPAMQRLLDRGRAEIVGHPCAAVHASQ